MKNFYPFGPVMKKKLISCTLLLTFHQIIAQNPVPLGVSGNWSMIFNDEFNGTSLDLAKWKPQQDWYTGPANGVTQPVQTNNETAAYDPAQNSVSGGTLKQALISNPITISGKTYPNRTGFIESIPFTLSYGYEEARMYIPAAGNGQVANWPIFWSSGPNWPSNGEIDVAEGLSGCMAYHIHSPNTTSGLCPSGNYTGWHVFGADWQQTSVAFYYDGIKVNTINLTGSGIVSNPVQNLIICNQAGVWGGPVVVPTTMEVDYVRVWKKSVTTNIQEHTTNVGVTVYPNPFNTNFTLIIPQETIIKNAMMKIYDVCGREIKSVLINSYETTIERGELQSGIYFYSIINNNEKIANGKLVVQ